MSASVWSTESRPLSFAHIAPKPLRWLWHNYIPRGKLSLLAGDPGSGKTALILDLAARLSRNDRLPPFPITLNPNPNLHPNPNPSPESPAVPSQAPSPLTQLNQLNDLNQLNPSPTLSPSDPRPSDPSPSSPDPEPSAGQATLLLSPEDNLNDTLAPRLLDLHADTSHIHTLPDFHSLIEPLTLNGQQVSALTYLDWIVQQIPNLALLAIDPITYYLGLTDRLAPANPLGGGVPSPRSILHKLARLAHVNNIAILLTTRLTKKCPDADPTSLRRALGSLAFASAARTVNLLLPNSDLAGEGDPGHTLLAPLKNNLAELPPALAFSAAGPEGQLEWDPDPIFLSYPDKPAPRSVPKDNSELGYAVKFLRLALADGPVRTTSLQEQARQNFISDVTLRRAMDFLDCDARKSGAWSNAWFWSLKGDNRPILSPMQTIEKEMRAFQDADPLMKQIEAELQLRKHRPQKKNEKVLKKT